MEKVIVNRMIRHFANGLIKIPAKFFRAEIKKDFLAKTRRRKEKKKRKIVFQVAFGKS